MLFQKKNKRTGAFQVYKKMDNGQTKIMNVKQRMPSMPFKNIKVIK